ncbi:hypothetical protein BGW42_007360 [Actinomortierella wolfii]|nr:hypothetical protein BGW42_007360 [Actinomortierella wolfii]
MNRVMLIIVQERFRKVQELRGRSSSSGAHSRDSVAFAEFRNVEASLKLAVATFITQGGTMAFKGQLPKLVETAFGQIKLTDGDFYTTIDELFAPLAADNHFQ